MTTLCATFSNGSKLSSHLPPQVQQRSSLFRQWQVSKAKLSLDLVEKREPIFQLVWEACSSYLQHYEPAKAKLAAIAIKNAVPRARFLFGKEIAEYMIDLATVMAKIDNADMRAARASNIITPDWIKPRHEAMERLIFEADDGCKDKFARFLNFNEWR